jgi:hypothetical protein
MLQESVVAIIPEESVRDVLPAIHRAGLGHVSRLVRAGRSPVLAQLLRAGIPISQAPESLSSCASALLVNAAARAPMTASLLLQHGASQVWTVSALGAWTESEDVILTQPNMHLLPPHPAQLVPGRDLPPAIVDPAQSVPSSDQAE